MRKPPKDDAARPSAPSEREAREPRTPREDAKQSPAEHGHERDRRYGEFGAPPAPREPGEGEPYGSATGTYYEQFNPDRYGERDERGRIANEREREPAREPRASDTPKSGGGDGGDVRSGDAPPPGGTDAAGPAPTGQPYGRYEAHGTGELDVAYYRGPTGAFEPQAHPGGGPRVEPPADPAIHDAVRARLEADGSLEMRDLAIAVSGGRVTLHGTVESRDAKRRAEGIAEALEGVRGVANHLRVRRRDPAGPRAGARARTSDEGRRRPYTPQPGTQVGEVPEAPDDDSEEKGEG